MVFNERISQKEPNSETLSEYIFYSAILVAIFLYFLSTTNVAKAYFPVIVPILIITVTILRNIQNFRLGVLSKTGWILIATYCAIGLAGFIPQVIDYFSVRKYALPILAFSVGIFRYRISTNGLAAFTAVLFITALLFSEGIDGGGTQDLLSTQASTESIFGVALGAICVTFFANNKSVLGILTLIACIVLFKRNAIFAAFSVIGLIVALKPLINSKKLHSIVQAVFAGVAILLGFMSFWLPDLFTLASESFLPGRSAAELSTGRIIIFETVISDVRNSGWIAVLLGHGTGSVERLISSNPYLGSWVNLAHNEYLSIFYDFGALGLLLVFLALWRFARIGLTQASLCLYIAIVVLVENILIITFVMMIIVFLLNSKIHEHNDVSIKKYR